MIGFFIGFLCLALLIAVLRGGRRGCGRGWHGGGRGRGGGWHGGHRHGGRGGAGWLGFVFDRLETTPSQEREIRAAVESLLEKRGELRREGEASRRDLARLMRTETLDETILGEAFARHDERLRELQKAFADALGKVHQALDPAQRERLAAFLERERDGWGGPYRGWI